jgi:hypothetical protein
MTGPSLTATGTLRGQKINGTMDKIRNVSVNGSQEPKVAFKGSETYEPAMLPSCENAFMNAIDTARLEVGR